MFTSLEQLPQAAHIARQQHCVEEENVGGDHYLPCGQKFDPGHPSWLLSVCFWHEMPPYPEQVPVDPASLPLAGNTKDNLRKKPKW